ncbi:hypothetical protein M9458_024295, partial [Cirrhinus mrigala]
QQLKDLQADLAQRVGELVTLRGQLRESQLQEAHTASRTRTLELEVCENELQRRKSENELLREKMSRLEDESATTADEQRLAGESEELKAHKQQTDRLKAELAYERQRSSDQAKSWEEEKDKVIRYQKQLQQNYVQMYKRNRDLERSLRQLSLELESRDQDDDSSGNEVTFDDIAATEI